MTTTAPTPSLSPAARRTRLALAATVLTLPLVAILISAALWWDTLPAEIASHWSGTGAADDAMSPSGQLAFAAGFAGVGALSAWVIAFVPRLSPRTRRGGLAFAGVFSGMGAAVWFVSTLLTLAAGDAYAAELGPWGLVLILSSGYGIIAAAIAPGGRSTPLHSDADITPIPLTDSEDSAWSQTVSSRMFMVIGVVLILVYAGLSVPLMMNAPAGVVIPTLLVGGAAVALVFLFARVRITVDRRGLRVTGLGGIPLKRIALDQITSVSVDTIDPGDWGGWGYRVMPGRSAVVLRRGPGFVVTTTSDRVFAATVHAPETPASLLSTLSGRTRHPDASA